MGGTIGISLGSANDGAEPVPVLVFTAAQTSAGRAADY